MDLKDECKLKAYETIITKVEQMALLTQDIIKATTETHYTGREYTEEEKQLIYNTSYKLEEIAGTCLDLAECVEQGQKEEII